MAKRKTVEVGGISVEVAETAFDNMEMVELLAKAQDGNILVLPKVCAILFGADRYESLKGELADEDGVCTATAMTEFVVDVMRKAGEEGKN